MIKISVPIDEYINKTFKVDDNMVELPKRVDETDREEKNIKLLTDGFVNGFIEGIKYVTKNLIEDDFNDSYIKELTGLSSKALNFIKDELESDD